MTKSITFLLGLLAGIIVLSGVHVDWPTWSHATSTSINGQVPPRVQPDVRDLSGSFVSLAENLSPSVVSIYTRSQTRMSAVEELDGPFGALPFAFNLPPINRESLGSGFVIDAGEGYIATNAHVVRMAGRNADEIMIKFIGEENGKGHAAKVVGADETSDVALLQLVDKKAGLRAAPMGDSSQARVGEWVLAIGNPYGHSHTVTEGIISGLGRSFQGVRSDFLQTSASINPGNSGGPLINMNGEVIGINSVIDPRAQNIGFAIPINSAKEVIAQLTKEGRVHRAWLGVGIEDINDETAAMMHLKGVDGVLVKQVLSDAPAAKSGIARYDVIRKIDGQEVHNSHDLFKVMDRIHAGTAANIEVLRDGANQTLKVHFGEEPARS